jgi:hypothetical protein
MPGQSGKVVLAGEAPDINSCSRLIRNFTGTYTVHIRGEEVERSMTKDLQELVDLARKIEMTPDQLREQRRSFAYGNTHIENDRITREMVADLDARLEAEHK